VSTLPNATCKRIRDNGNGSGDGLYRIDPVGNGGYDVWCDMSTDGGGWTMSVMLADSTTQNLFYTTNTDKIIDLKTNIATR
jgi:Fibrinogen beta and gamma chains, C-terminal globular domain